MITLRCTCGETFHAEEAHLGKAVRCRCGQVLEIKRAAPAAPSTSRELAPHARQHQPTGALHFHLRGRWRAVLAAAVLSALGVVLLLLAGTGHPAYQPSLGPVAGGYGTTFDSLEGSPLVLTPPPTPATTDARCRSGHLVRPRSSEELGGHDRGGLGQLRIANGTAFDAVAVLLESPTRLPRRAIYIRQKETGVITQIPPGTYQLQFQLGGDWPRHGMGFCQVQATSEFDRPLAFTERPSNDGTYYSTFEVTLQPVPEGTATTHDIPRSAFRLPPS